MKEGRKMSITSSTYNMVTALCTIKRFEKRAHGKLKAVQVLKEISVGTLFVDFEPLRIKQMEFKGLQATVKIYRAYHKNEEVGYVRYFLDFENLITHEEIISVEERKKLCP